MNKDTILTMAFNMILLGMFYTGQSNDIYGFTIIPVFTYWFISAIMIFMLFSESARKSSVDSLAKKKNKICPKEITYLCYALEILIFSYYSHVFLACALVMSFWGYGALHSDLEKRNENQD